MMLQLRVTCVRSVARHQADCGPCLVQEEDYSGGYQQLNARTLYSPTHGRYLELSADGMARARAGQPIVVGPNALS